jgi:2-C-methyl-D-erythritol 4-phosphate cytidylyltransferase
MQLYAIIVAGGSGKRMGADTPKQFIELAGRPVLMHTIERFREFNEKIEIITVLPENQLRYWRELQAKYSFNVPQTLVKGGSARFFSVRNGLEFVTAPGLVAIHDGVRPLVSSDTIRRCFEEAGKSGSAVPVISPLDSLRMIDEKGNEVVDRRKIRIIQTPQVFDSVLLKKAYTQKYQPEFTDDATVFELMGEKINLVDGNRENIKITTPEDLLIADALLQEEKGEI